MGVNAFEKVTGQHIYWGVHTFEKVKRWCYGRNVSFLLSCVAMCVAPSGGVGLVRGRAICVNYGDFGPRPRESADRPNYSLHSLSLHVTNSLLVTSIPSTHYVKYV